MFGRQAHFPSRSTPISRPEPSPSTNAARELVARLNRLPATRTIWRLIALLSLALFFELYDLLLTGWIAPGLTASGLLTTTTPGLFGTSGIASFVAALFAGLTVGTLMAGSFADRFGRRSIFTWAMLAYTACSVAMACQTSAWGLNLFRFLAGVGLGIEHVTIDTYLSELVPKHVRGRAFALSQTCGFAAGPVVGALAWLLVPRAPFGIEGWRWVVLIGAASAIAVWYIRRRLPESPRWLMQAGRFEEAEAILVRLERQVESEYGAALPAPVLTDVSAKSARFAEILAPPYRRRAIMLAVFNVAQSIGFYGFANWAPTLLVARGVGITQSLAYTALIAVAQPVAPLLGVLLGDRLERKWLIAGAAATAAVCGLAFSAVSQPLAVIGVGVLITMANSTMSFAYHAYQAELFPTRLRAKAVGCVYSFSRASAAVSAFVIAFVLRTFGVAGVFMFIFAALMVVVVTISVFGPRTTGRSLEEISR
jgi:putative MFS transporter